MDLHVSKNELTTSLEKAAVGQGYDQGTGQWLGFVVVQAVENGHPALTWALTALHAEPERPKLQRRASGWVALNRAVLVAGPLLTDLHRAGEPLDGQGFDRLDVPALWTHLLNASFVRKPGPLCIDAAQWQILQTLAAKTYVPTSDESRARGAGSTVSDTD